MSTEYTKGFDCPELKDLINYRSGECPSEKANYIEIHQQVCSSCAQELESLQTVQSGPADGESEKARKMPDQLKRLAEEEWKRIRELRTPGNLGEIELGQIWSTKAEVVLPGKAEPARLTDQPRLVAIVLDDKDAYDSRYPEIRVAPISTETFNASQFDLFIEQDKSPLGYEFMVECWNTQPMLKENLDLPLCRLKETQIRDILILMRAQFSQTGFDLAQISARVGLALESDTDPRIKFQEREIQATEYLRYPVNLLPFYWQDQEEETENKVVNVPAEDAPLWTRFIAFWHSPVQWIPISVTAVSIIVALFFLTAAIRQSKQIANLKAELGRVREANEETQRNYENARTTIENLQAQVAELQQTLGSSSSIVASLTDGSRLVMLDKQGNLSGVEHLSPPHQQLVKTALERSAINVPREVRRLVEKGGTLMGGSADGVPFALRSPVGTAVLNNQPKFVWQALEGATSYEVTVYINDPKFKVAVPGEPVSGTEWRPPHPLEYGRLYHWQVTAHKGDEEIVSPTPPAPEAKFKVLEESKIIEIERARQRYAGSHLILGILYAQAGLLDDAEREFRALLAANPNSPVAQKLWQSMKALR